MLRQWIYGLVVMLAIAYAVGCKSDAVVMHYGSTLRDGQKTYHPRQMVNLDSIESYDRLKELVDSLACEGPLPTVKFQIGDTIKYVSFNNICWDNFICVLIKSRNVLSFIDDKVNRDRIYNLSEMDLIMYNHYFNPDKSMYWSEDPRKAVISITYKGKDIKHLSMLLNKITNAYDKLELELPLIVAIGRR